ncbi:MAG TPA: farnesyl diphosphate synthase [Candidatus Polarisedimenticolia bacterium]|nr:farnesyl diphosphate synthase [Candidatus Polarisedimenticolia bacterium]
MKLGASLRAERRSVDRALRRCLPATGSVPPTVRRAMLYSLFPGGKRLRPILAIAACRALGGRVADVLPSACAIEMIHTYSLIHDDLPALDNDDLRRGRATSHRVFGEAMAILAGDALLTHAFEVIATFPRARRLAARKLRAAALLARAAGVSGMIGGQVMDLEAEGRPYSYRRLTQIHRSKTGALISAAVQIGGIVAGARPAPMRALATYGDQIGLAFQIIDDILDQEGSSDRLGKTAGKDARSRKATFPALLGLDASRRRAAEATRRAIAALAPLGSRGRPLAGIARFLVDRVS